MRAAWLISLTVLALSCRAPNDARIVVSSEEFWSLYNQQRFGDIYELSSDEMKQASTRDEFVTFLERLQRKLGLHVLSDDCVQSVEYGTRGEYRQNQCSVQFSSGKGTAYLIWKISEGGPALYRFNVESRDLVVQRDQ